jgi:formate dehydrogenase beta subunit
MKLDRRDFLRIAGSMATTSLIMGEGNAHAGRDPKIPGDPYGCLVDLSECVGCRKCEQACNQVNDLPEPPVPFDDLTVLDTKRRPDEKAYTVINRYWTGRRDERNQLLPSFVKVQCMHCQDPACVSACIVGALTKKENGAVHYDVSKCIGCRYCMVACPFQIPAYEYHDPWTPRVMKCSLCHDRISKAGGKPGCASVCPTEAITFGKRSDLLKLAHNKVESDPGRYRQKIYGEHEVGGTSWLYISRDPFEKLGFISLPSHPMPHLAETVQHSIFAYFWAPLTLFGLLTGAMAVFNRTQLKPKLDARPENEEDKS